MVPADREAYPQRTHGHVTTLGILEADFKSTSPRLCLSRLLLLWVPGVSFCFKSLELESGADLIVLPLSLLSPLPWQPIPVTAGHGSR